jgi:hypothetical protein
MKGFWINLYFDQYGKFRTSTEYSSFASALYHKSLYNPEVKEYYGVPYYVSLDNYKGDEPKMKCEKCGKEFTYAELENKVKELEAENKRLKEQQEQISYPPPYIPNVLPSIPWNQPYYVSGGWNGTKTPNITATYSDTNA